MAYGTEAVRDMLGMEYCAINTEDSLLPLHNVLRCLSHGRRFSAFAVCINALYELNNSPSWNFFIFRTMLSMLLCTFQFSSSNNLVIEALHGG